MGEKRKRLRTWVDVCSGCLARMAAEGYCLRFHPGKDTRIERRHMVTVREVRPARRKKHG